MTSLARIERGVASNQAEMVAPQLLEDNETESSSFPVQFRSHAFGSKVLKDFPRSLLWGSRIVLVDPT